MKIHFVPGTKERLEQYSEEAAEAVRKVLADSMKTAADNMMKEAFTPFPPELVPTCDKCNKQVGAIEKFRDPRKRVDVFRVHCHGEVEEAELTESQLYDHHTGKARIKAGRAFIQRKALP
jgi:hypothetical protein